MRSVLILAAVSLASLHCGENVPAENTPVSCPGGVAPPLGGGCLKLQACVGTPEFLCCDDQRDEVAAECEGDTFRCPPGTARCDHEARLVQGEACSPTSLPCQRGTSCEFPDHLCGSVQTGVCTGIFDTCGPGDERLCGCDGRIYDAVCQAQVAGVDLTEPVYCELGPDDFACGLRICSRTATHCSIINGTTGCQPLWGGCAGCNCVLLQPDCLCSGDTTSGIVVDCRVLP